MCGVAVGTCLQLRLVPYPEEEPNEKVNKETNRYLIIIIMNPNAFCAERQVQGKVTQFQELQQLIPTFSH